MSIPQPDAIAAVLGALRLAITQLEQEQRMGAEALDGAKPSEDDAWNNLARAAKSWADYLDQWDKIQFQTRDGPIYVSISREVPDPSTFEDISERYAIGLRPRAKPQERGDG